MDIPTGLTWLLGWGRADTFWEDLMELPPCPLCKEGRLLPLSDEHEPFALWICSAPNCAYAISKDPTGDTFYKGVASTQEKEKGAKKWTEYGF
jgi:hypothetical protein